MQRVVQAWRGLWTRTQLQPPRRIVPIPLRMAAPNPKSRKDAIGARIRQRMGRTSGGNITKQPSEPQFCRSLKEYALRFKDLTSGVERLEAAERKEKDVSDQITQQVATENDAQPYTSARLAALDRQHDATIITIRKELNEMSTHADIILDSLDDQDSDSPLPTYVTVQLKRYDDARSAFVLKRASVWSEDILLEKICATLFWAENRMTSRGWIPTQGELPFV